MSENTPKILHSALRQYQHNDCSGLLVAFDYSETVEIVDGLEAQLTAERELSVALRDNLDRFIKRLAAMEPTCRSLFQEGRDAIAKYNAQKGE